MVWNVKHRSGFKTEGLTPQPLFTCIPQWLFMSLNQKVSSFLHRAPSWGVEPPPLLTKDASFPRGDEKHRQPVQFHVAYIFWTARSPWLDIWGHWWLTPISRTCCYNHLHLLHRVKVYSWKSPPHLVNEIFLSSNNTVIGKAEYTVYNIICEVQWHIS